MFDLMSIIVPIIFIIVIWYYCFFSGAGNCLRGIRIISHLDQPCQLLLLRREKIFTTSSNIANAGDASGDNTDSITTTNTNVL